MSWKFLLLLRHVSELTCLPYRVYTDTEIVKMAPLDIKFNSSGDQAWVTFHGSW